MHDIYTRKCHSPSLSISHTHTNTHTHTYFCPSKIHSTSTFLPFIFFRRKLTPTNPDQHQTGFFWFSICSANIGLHNNKHIFQNLYKYSSLSLSYGSPCSPNLQSLWFSVTSSRTNPGFPARMVYLYFISCLRYTILVRNPWNTGLQGQSAL